MTNIEITLLKLVEAGGNEAINTLKEYSESQIPIENIEKNNLNVAISNFFNIIKGISTPRVLKNYEYYKSLDSSQYRAELILWYYYNTGHYLDLDNPQTFSEKQQYLKLYDCTPLKTKLADKYLAREWVADKIGSKYIVPLLGVWDSFDEIDFNKLPIKFILKANHGCGWNFIVENKNTLDYTIAKKNFDTWLNTSYAFCSGFEMHYNAIKPKIIAEEYLYPDYMLYDYKFMCFNGIPEFFWVNNSRYSGRTRDFRDMNWNQTPFWVVDPGVKHLPDLKQPKAFHKMKELATVLADGFPFVRVDFYYIPESDSIYFSEMTFISEQGIAKWNEDKYDFILGDLLHLPKKGVECGK